MVEFRSILKSIWLIIEIIFYFVLSLFHHILYFFKNELLGSAELSKDEHDARTTVLSTTIDKYAAIKDWWKPEGNLKGLHNLNAVRLPFFIDGLTENLNEKFHKPLKGLKILDVGCGCGFVSEPLAKLGASVTGIDPSETLIKGANDHKELDPELESNLTYIATTVEEHLDQYSNYYDAVIASEVINHLINPELFVKCCVKTLKPGGKIFFTTPNRTWLTKFGYVFIVENVFKIVPRGLFKYENFITPDELTTILGKNHCRVEKKQGHLYNFFNWTWIKIQPLCSFYGLQATKIK